MRCMGAPPSNDELQRTSDGTAAGSPLNSVLGGHQNRPGALRNDSRRAYD